MMFIHQLPTQKTSCSIMRNAYGSIIISMDIKAEIKIHVWNTQIHG